MTRRRATEGQVLKVLLGQGAVIPCFRCRTAFVVGEKIEREHVLELALGGSDEPENWRYSHLDCHKIITNGSKATSAGSSKHRIAKVRRLRGENKPRIKRKIPSRGFEKRTK